MNNETIDRTLIDKTGWGEGPWSDEPDRIEWEHAGLPCLMVRHERLGHWCGYAAVPPGHPLHGKDYDDVFDWDKNADYNWPHGGLTYASLCSHNVCHVPKPGEPEDVFWFGFDCAHCDDFSPGMTALLRESMPRFRDETYREVPYVQAETNRLAAFLSEVAA